jgi:penicillin-binding protein 2
VDMGIDRLSTYMAQFGFGKPTGIDLPGEASGVLPSREWKLANRQQVWFPGETVISGIGQGYWVTTPLQLAQATAMLADGGIRRPLHLLRASQSGFDVARKEETRADADESVVRNPANLAAVTQSMVRVLHGPDGTVRRVAQEFQLGYQIAGKTGTAQRVTRRGEAALEVNDLPYNLRHNALFIAFAPAEAPRVAVMVVVEHGGSGSAVAAPVALRIVDAWLRKSPQ